MAVYVREGEKIEAQKSEIISLKIITGSIMDDLVLGIVRKYSCDRNSSVEITEEVNPKVPKVDGSHLNLGDKLQADKIFFLTKHIKKIDYEIMRRSYGHRGQQIITPCYTFAEISKSTTAIINAIGKRKLKE